MTAAPRIAAALMAGTVLVLGLPIGAVAADDEVVPSRLTVGGKPLAALVRTEPTAPFVAYESGYVSTGIRADDTERADNEDEQPRSMRKSVLIGAGIGAGAGLAMGGTTCWNEGGRVLRVRRHRRPCRFWGRGRDRGLGRCSHRPVGFDASATAAASRMQRCAPTRATGRSGARKSVGSRAARGLRTNHQERCRCTPNSFCRSAFFT